MIIGASWGLELEVCVNGRSMLANSTRNTKGEIQLLTVTFSFKVSPKDLHNNNVFLKDPDKNQTCQNPRTF